MTEKKKSEKQKVLLSGLVLGMLISGQSFAEAQDEARSQVDFNNLQTVDSLLADKTLRAGSNYDGRIYRYIPNKTVGSTNEGWAISASRLFEFNGIYSADYSERHMDYATALNSTNEGTPDANYRNLGSGGNSQVALGYFTSGKGPIAEEDMPWQDNLNRVSLSAVQGKKVLKKIDDYRKFPSIYKYRENGVTYAWDRGSSYYTGGQVALTRDEIKEHILKNGAVISRIYRADQYFQYNYITSQSNGYWTQEYHSGSGSHSGYWYDVYVPGYKNYAAVPGGLSYYCTEKNATPNHEVVIIRWDDDYTNAYTGAPQRGAYIAIDSDYFYKQWYANITENSRWWKDDEYIYNNLQTTNTNIYYISYEDYFVESNVYGIGNTSYDVNYSNIYQHDPLGMSTAITGQYSGQTTYGANVFKRNTTVAQKLKEVSVASTMALKYEIYVNPKDGDLTEDKLIKVATTDKLDAGYHSIKLNDQNIMLTGDKFAVVVKYIADPSTNSDDWQSSIAKMGVEAPFEVYYEQSGDTVVRKTRDINYFQNATSTPTQSYMSEDMREWKDLYENTETRNMNLCIKAFVKDDPYYVQPVEKVEINKTELTLIKGDEETLQAKVYPDGVIDSKIYWTSSNRNIATVDNTGKVTAVAGGEATIYARSSNANVYAECKLKVDVPVENLVLNQKEVTILANETHILAPIVSPDDATTKEVQWSSSNTNVCRVTDDGVLIGLKQGRAIITALIKDAYGTHTATCNIVIPESLLVDVTGVKLNKTTMTLKKGDRETLEATILPEDATNKTVVWTSSNKSVATVNANGRVTGLSAGKTTITVTTVNGGETASCEVTVTEAAAVPVTGISLSKTKLPLEIGQSEILSATITPSNSTNKNVIWTSSNEDVAVVNANGKVSAIGAGSAVITAKSEDGSHTAECNVSVTKPTVRVTGVKLNKTGVTLEKDATLSLIADVLPYDATNTEVTWTSSNPEVATVDDKGLVKAISDGTAMITVKTKDGNFEKTCLVSVTSNVAVTGITLDQTSLNMVTSRTIDLKASIEPVNATNKNIIWTSSDEEVAVVNSGKVVSLKAGSATITAKTEDGSFEATCEITVEEQNTDITLSSERYLISTDKVIYGIGTSTMSEDFLKNIETNEGTTVQILDREGNPVENGTKIGTGMTLQLSKTIEVNAPEEGEGTTGGSEEGTEETPTIVTEQYVILVNGDIDGDGEKNATDLSISINYVIGETELDPKYLSVIDLNNDGEVTLSDIVLLRQEIVNN